MTMHLKNPVDAEVARKMAVLVARGREALAVYIEGLPLDEQPLGGRRAVPQDFPVVTRADYVAFADLCLEHVITNGVCLHVLCENGAIGAVLDKRFSKWSATTKR